jgi:hypothetical protein
MFEELINYKVELISSSFNQLEFIQFDDLKKLETPLFIKKYFEGFIISKILELKRTVNQGQLNFDDKEISECWQIFIKLFQDKFTFTKDDYQKNIKNACELFFNFIIRPQTTLISYIYRDEFLIPIAVIHERLNYFPDDNSLITSLRMWYEQKYFQLPDNELIDRKTFRDLIFDLEKDNYKILNINDILNWFQPIFECNIINEDGEPILPIAALYLFFDDKKWIGLKQFLAKFSSDSELNGITKEQLTNFLFSYQKEIITSSQNIQTEIENISIEPSQELSNEYYGESSDNMNIESNSENNIQQMDENSNFTTSDEIQNIEAEAIEEMTKEIQDIEAEVIEEMTKEIQDIEAEAIEEMTKEIQDIEINDNEINELFQESHQSIADEIKQEEENFDFDALADSILGFETEEKPIHKITENKQKENTPEKEGTDEEINSTIQELMFQLETKFSITTDDLNYEIEKINKSDLKFVNIEAIENETKRELCKLILDIKE